MEWADVLADPSLKNLPYKIELDHYGLIVMSPASNRHARIQARGAAARPVVCRRRGPDRVLDRHAGGGEGRGCRVADVVWVSPDFVHRHGDATPFPDAPELCVEIVSPSNRAAEMAQTVALYLNASAREVWLVGEDGAIALHGPEGRRTASVFPITPPAILS